MKLKVQFDIVSKRRTLRFISKCERICRYFSGLVRMPCRIRTADQAKQLCETIRSAVRMRQGILAYHILTKKSIGLQDVVGI